MLLQSTANTDSYNPYDGFRVNLSAKHGDMESAIETDSKSIQSDHQATYSYIYANEALISAALWPRIFFSGEGFFSFCAAMRAEVRATAAYKNI